MGVFLQQCESKPRPANRKHILETKGACAIIRRHVCARTWIKRSADHAREDDEDEGQHLQIGCQDGCAFHMTHVLSRQGPLYNHLHLPKHI